MSWSREVRDSGGLHDSHSSFDFVSFHFGLLLLLCYLGAWKRIEYLILVKSMCQCIRIIHIHLRNQMLMFSETCLYFRIFLHETSLNLGRGNSSLFKLGETFTKRENYDEEKSNWQPSKVLSRINGPISSKLGIKYLYVIRDSNNVGKEHPLLKWIQVSFKVEIEAEPSFAKFCINCFWRRRSSIFNWIVTQ